MKTLIENINSLVESLTIESFLKNPNKNTTVYQNVKDESIVYTSLEEAFQAKANLADFTTIQISAKDTVLKALNDGSSITSTDINNIKKLLQIVELLDEDKEYRTELIRLNNQIMKARKEGNEENIKKLEQLRDELNAKFGKISRRRKQ